MVLNIYIYTKYKSPTFLSYKSYTYDIIDSASITFLGLNTLYKTNNQTHDEQIYNFSNCFIANSQKDNRIFCCFYLIFSHNF